MLKLKVKVVLRVTLFSAAAVTVYFLLLKPPTQVTLPAGVTVAHYDLFEPVVSEDFPFIPGQLKIPRIIHQTWKSTDLPYQFIGNIKSYVKNNEGWKYYFWTDESARKLIKETHPDLIPVWDTYAEGIRRADVLRYVVLYEFGGVYADLDSVCLRPLDKVITKYPCIFPPEPYEHATLIFQSEYMITNSIMLCRPKHPFLKQLIDKLPSHAHMAATVDSTGPAFVTAQYMAYHWLSSQDLSPSYQTMNQSGKAQTFKSLSFNFGTIRHEPDDTVYVPNSQFFQYSIDRTMYGVFYDRCTISFHTLPYISQRGCVHLFTRGGMTRPLSKYAFTDHTWYHSYYKYNLLEWMLSEDIANIVPHRIIYTGHKLKT